MDDQRELTSAQVRALGLPRFSPVDWQDEVIWYEPLDAVPADSSEQQG